MCRKEIFRQAYCQCGKPFIRLSLEPSLIRNGSRFYIGNPDSDTLFAMNPDRTLEPLLVRTPSHSEEGNKYGLFLRGAGGLISF